MGKHSEIRFEDLDLDTLARQLSGAKSREDAEDAVGEAILLALQSQQSLKNPEQFVRRVSFSRLIVMYRRHENLRRGPKLSDVHCAVPFAQEESDFDIDEQIQDLDLSETEAETLAFILEGIDSDETAILLGLLPKTITTRRLQLRRKIEALRGYAEAS